MDQDSHDDTQDERFREALEKKNEEAREQGEAASVQAQEDQLAEHDRTQDVQSVRAKNSGHGQKTADKWNQ